MDDELSRMVEPHMDVEIQWQDVVDLAMKFDETRKRRNTYTRPRPSGRILRCLDAHIVSLKGVI